ncbi:MAG TPA: 1-acyl-sn-glycerol-3-phosphate acyltransferase [Candidatus Hydrogenedentes bacterium]|nr:1-acyl-sn-glycerol-3-phosphate acyltransferase [Candidatus Hydrogenedentota bacterium]
MQFIKRWTRFLIIFGVMTPVLYLLRLLIWPTALYSEALDRRLRRTLLRLWARSFALIAGVRVIAHGAPPKPPMFLVANHLSYLDMLVIGHQTGCIFVSREDVQYWPILGFMAKSLYIIFIDRKDKRDTVRVNKLIAHTLKMGDGLAIFPESRIFCGQDVEPFKSSLIEPAVANKIPVHYATICYETPEGSPPATRIVAWWRPEPFFQHLFRFLSHRGCTATVYFGEEPLFGDDRKELAERLHEAVRKNYVPML